MANLLNQLDIEDLANLDELGELDNIEEISPKNFKPMRRKYNRPKDEDWKIERDKLKKQKQKERDTLSKQLQKEMEED